MAAGDARNRTRRRLPLLPFAVLGTAAVFGGLIAWAAFSGDATPGPGVSAALPPPARPAATPAAVAETAPPETAPPDPPKAEAEAATPPAPAAEQILPVPEAPAQAAPPAAAEHHGVPAPAPAAESPSPASTSPAHASPAPTSPAPSSPTAVSPPAASPPAASAPAASPPAASAPAASTPDTPTSAITALTPAPDPLLVQAGRDGGLPVIGPDGRQPWRVYARPFRDITARPRIAIVVAGLGLRESTSVEAIEKLPPDITLAFTPYARNLDQWSMRTRAAGHEFLIQVPMEPIDFPTSDPGPKALMTALSAADNKSRLEWTLGRTTGYIGVMTYMGSRYTADSAAMAETAKQLRARGLMILDSRTADNSAIPAVARPLGLPTATAVRFIDATPTRAAVDGRLAELERFARQNGTAIGIAADYPGSIERIAAWAATLPEKGLVLAPVSALADTVDAP
ncbi:divergent polysaccharide deacetylase family protein [Zavarzinia compransoris]|uniref:Divergent polysaccharide deacetylase family protein n=1 Tax=Zavarzinia compransoris TaxID=1264899 RepID=A0A317E8R9_9PROT|nr:divergent polysaccharide deacetylase family protein [Zavarzinia compransoris]PWR21703.1 divergent polysaccharide deacetylase family protein [Zavarzinia compransoris]TDP45511.1 hypothetical protein DES42_105217 [Zavarzinia compransoris]